MVDLGIPAIVLSEDNKEYLIEAFEASFDNVKDLWEKFNKFDKLFCDQLRGDFRKFTETILSANTIILKVSDIGVVYVTDLIPGDSAQGHFLFWDRKSAGRHRIILAALQWVMDNFDLHRVSIEVPRHAYNALHRLYKIGFRVEGVLKKAQLFEGERYDIFLFGVLRDEITDQALQEGHLERTESERGWFGLLNKETDLMKYVLRSRDERSDAA